MARRKDQTSKKEMTSKTFAAVTYKFLNFGSVYTTVHLRKLILICLLSHWVTFGDVFARKVGINSSLV